ncbi:uncharacterized protein LOC127720713 isoform X1 [Mytilus californianus]|uniref:uncharacterized protein LOC127720713 isoform X1 n=1 Tax=Mytilus californianus TaxID=6549 RepID=UPI0022455011|nr:uncharacterized protein LOC127720713 isoform X1 [Mytilus californianus]
MTVSMQTFILFFHCIVCLEAVRGYVYYPTLSRHCIPYLNCEPGNEIQPCTDNYMHDLCKPCRSGMVQPELISSTGNISKSLCFQPRSECLARDLIHSRTEKDVFCNSLKGCKCDTTKCYFGDPCLCDSNKPCAVGHTMNEKGVCSPCPKDTFKNETGCGPCRRKISVDFMPKKNSQSLQTEHHMNSEPQQQLSTDTLIKVSKLRSSKAAQKDNSKMFIIIAVLGVSLVVLSVFIMTICKRKKGITLSGSISLTDGKRQDKQRDGRRIPLHDQLPLLHGNQGTQQDKQPDGRPVALCNHLPLLHRNQVHTIGNQTLDSYLNNKYLPAYSTEGSNSDLISGVSGFKDLDHVGWDGSIEEQIDNLKLQVFSINSEGHQTTLQSNRRTLRKIPTESEDKNYVATVPMSDLDKKDENYNNVSSNSVITSGNTDADEHFGFAYQQKSMHSYIQQGSVDEPANNSYSSGYKSSILNYAMDNDDPISGSFITMHSPVFDSLATEELPSSIETYTFNMNGNNGF